ncbi:heme-binding domain-containing protein [Gaiella sp.]|uniref:heme-binding domain-containing protein n=1 Tax=Gaiella sp. TaxID=2663207 RepID=UPI0039832D04
MRLFFRLFLLLVVVGLVIQVVPYGRDHENPKTVQEIKWNTPATRTLASNGCMDCHSNLTTWPWYTSIAPVSWLTSRDVEEGRAKLNFSEWQQAQEVDLQEVIDVIREKEMPPLQYRAMHSEARLTATERQQLEAGLVASWKADPPGP